MFSKIKKLFTKDDGCVYEPIISIREHTGKLLIKDVPGEYEVVKLETSMYTLLDHHRNKLVITKRSYTSLDLYSKDVNGNDTFKQVSYKYPDILSTDIRKLDDSLYNYKVDSLFSILKGEYLNHNEGGLYDRRLTKMIMEINSVLFWNGEDKPMDFDYKFKVYQKGYVFLYIKGVDGRYYLRVYDGSDSGDLFQIGGSFEYILLFLDSVNKRISREIYNV